MRIAKVQFSSWDKSYDFSFDDLQLIIGDSVIVTTELGTELGMIVGIKKIDDSEFEKPSEEKTKTIKPITRKATEHDFEKLPTEKDKREAIKFCRSLKEKHNLAMKFIDVHFSYDGSRITFAFIADGRVDFRLLVKDLTRHFSRTIRLQQIGIRDEAKIMGDYGHCGKTLCCKKFLNELSSITSDMAEIQQCSHRGSDRISGVCGRLMCCLSYEQKGYEESLKKLPEIGKKVSVDGKRGTVIGHHILKESVDVKFEAEKGESSIIAEVDLNRNKKKKEN